MKSDSSLAPRHIPQVMVSSTFTDLIQHRAAMIDAIQKHKLHPNVMEYDDAKVSGDLIDSSLSMVRDSAAYILVMGLKYGQIPACPVRNPKNLSITELEFDEAQRLNRPILLFIMHDDHPVKKSDIEKDPEKEAKLSAFRERAKKEGRGSSVDRVYSVFTSLDDFKGKIASPLAELFYLLKAGESSRAERGSDQSPASSPFWAPALPDHFVGREPMLGILRERLREPGAIVPLTGMPGLGKTMLATKFAHEHSVDFEAVYWIACAGLTALAAATTLSEQLGLKPEGDLTSILHEAHRALGRDHNLLVLDGMDSADLEPVVPQRGRTSVLITSRNSDLPFLAGFEAPELQVFTAEDCLALFGAYDLPESVTEHTAQYQELAERLGYLPVAIAVAGGLLKRDMRHSLRGLLAAEDLHKLVHGKHDLGRLFDLAIESATENSQRLLSAMAACAPNGFRLGLAAEIAEMDLDSALDAFQELRGRSLVDEVDRGALRARLHSLLRRRVRHRQPLDERHAEVVGAVYTNWRSHRLQCDEDLDDMRLAVEWTASQEDSQLLYEVAYSGFSFLYSRGLLAEAEAMMQTVEEKATGSSDRDGLQRSYGNQALILQAWGRLDDAMALLKKQESICEELGDRASLQASYGNQALIFRSRGWLDDAMASLKQQESICEELGDRASLQASYGNQALILRSWGWLDDAMASLKQQESICEELGDRDGLQQSYGNQALILQDWGRLDEAMALHKKEEAICEELGDRAGLQASYGNQAVILQDWGRLDEAMALNKKQEAICEELGDRAGLQASYGNQAVILQSWGRLDDAMALLKKKEAICEELGDRAGLQRSYGNQALILRSWGRLDDAMALLKNAETICEELGDRDGLQASYGNQALILKDWGRLDDAMALRKKEETICEELGDRDGLGRSYGNQASILWSWGRLDDAMALLKMQETICEELGDRDGLGRSYGNQASILKDWGRLDDAMALHKKGESICEELGDRDGLGRSYGNQASILKDWGRLDDAMALHRKEENICRELNLLDCLRISLENQAILLVALKRPDEAAAKDAESKNIYRQIYGDSKE